MFATDIVETVEVDGGTVVVRKLSHVELNSAADEKLVTQAKQAKVYGPDLQRVFRETAQAAAERERRRLEERGEKPTPPTEKELRDARYGEYDYMAILTKGVKSWSHDRKLNRDALEALDQPTADVLFKRIVDLSCGPITVPAAEEEVSKG